MANFIRIGETVINVEQVIDFDLTDEQVTVCLALTRGSKGDIYPRLHTFKDNEAKALREWVDQHAYVLPVEAEEKPKGADLVAF